MSIGPHHRLFDVESSLKYWSRVGYKYIKISTYLLGYIELTSLMFSMIKNYIFAVILDGAIDCNLDGENMLSSS